MNLINISNPKLAAAINNLEDVIKDKIDQIQNQNQEIFANHHKKLTLEKENLKQKIQELNAQNQQIKMAGAIIINEIKADLENIKKIINSN